MGSERTKASAGHEALRVVVSWNGTVVQERTLAAPSVARRVTIGRSTRNDLVVEGEHVPDTAELFSREPGGYALSVLPGMGGRIHLGAETLSAADWAGQTLLVAPGCWGLLRYAGVTIYFQFVVPEAAPRRRLLGGLDTSLLAALWFSFLLQLGFVFIAELLWEPVLDRAEYALPDRAVRFEVTLPPDVAPDAAPDDPSDDDGEASASARDGDPEASAPDAAPATNEGPISELAPRSPGPLDAPVLRALDGAIGQNGALTQLFGQQSIAGGMDADFVPSGGGDPFSLRPRMGRGRCDPSQGPCGPGGNGFGEVGQIGGIERGHGDAPDSRLGRRAQRVLRGDVRAEALRTDGDFLSDEQVRDVVRRHTRGLRHCYEALLRQDPGLEGRLVANWTVDLDGRVARRTIESNSTGSEELGECLLREIDRMRFPVPDGGMVVVRFPFTFASRE
jgi:hypothetical protein